MSRDRDVTDHYSKETLLDALMAALKDDGADLDALTLEDLAPYDQFHGRGMEATLEVAELLSCAPEDTILDIGCGIGGPARFMADHFGCRVVGIDLTPSFVDVADRLTRNTDMDAQVSFNQGNALSMAFENDAFDAAYSMNVSMNIADKKAFYAETFRVLKPGGTLVLSELSKGATGEVSYPTPWARTPNESFLATLEETVDGLKQAGFTIATVKDTAAETIAYGANARAMVERGEKPPHRAVQLIHGEIAQDAMRNTAAAVKSGAAVPIEILCKK